MKHNGVVLTAGFNKSKPAIAIAELLKRRGIHVNGFIVISPYSWKRLNKYMRKRGISFLWEAVPRLLGSKSSNINSKLDCLANFLKEQDITTRSIKKWASNNQADYIFVKTINDKKAQNYLKKNSPEWLIYSGGGILKKAIINIMDGRILNAHQGPLPKIRGMNAAEWSLLLNEKQTVSIHLIDKGIDTGKIITKFPFSVNRRDTINDIRNKAKIKGIKGLVKVASEKNLSNYDLRENSNRYRQCYILSPIMKELLKKKLAQL
jgi:folate-dependent phosphoribosylglycinamide formyltransferase PurN